MCFNSVVKNISRGLGVPEIFLYISSGLWSLFMLLKILVLNNQQGSTKTITSLLPSYVNCLGKESCLSSELCDWFTQNIVMVSAPIRAQTYTLLTNQDQIQDLVCSFCEFSLNSPHKVVFILTALFFILTFTCTPSV